MQPVIFLGIDGVLNTLNKDSNIYNGISKDCVAQLNRVIKKANAQLVIISSWRYLVHDNHCDLSGLGGLLNIYGIYCKDRVIGVIGKTNRQTNESDLITEWMEKYGKERRYIVSDQKFYQAHPNAIVNPLVGLTEQDADQIILHLVKS